MARARPAARQPCEYAARRQGAAKAGGHGRGGGSSARAAARPTPLATAVAATAVTAAVAEADAREIALVGRCSIITATNYWLCCYVFVSSNKVTQIDRFKSRTGEWHCNLDFMLSLHITWSKAAYRVGMRMLIDVVDVGSM